MAKSIEKKRRSSHQTQWASQFAVASELCKRGYEVALTMGNHPNADLMVYSPAGKAFVIDVKGLYKKNFWAVRKKLEKECLFYVLAFVPQDAPNRYFILTQAQINAGIDAEFVRAQTAAREKGKDSNWVEKFPGVAWSYAEQWENAWRSLPA
ncbi:MAG: hypothetical protein QM744_10875 [Mesorhizobium sp.]